MARMGRRYRTPHAKAAKDAKGRRSSVEAGGVATEKYLTCRSLLRLVESCGEEEDSRGPGGRVFRWFWARKGLCRNDFGWKIFTTKIEELASDSMIEIKKLFTGGIEQSQFGCFLSSAHASSVQCLRAFRRDSGCVDGL